MAIIAIAALGIACGNSGGSPASGGSAASGSAAPKSTTVGQPMTASGGESVTVVSFKRAVPPDNQFSKPAAGKECTQLVLNFNNGSKAEWSLPTFEVKVVDSSGQKYDTGLNCPSSDNVNSLVAGGKATAKEYYEVPTGSALNANWVPNAFSSEVYETPLK